MGTIEQVTCRYPSCGQVFIPRKGSGGSPQVYCRNLCHQRHYAQLHPPDKKKGRESSQRYYYQHREAENARVSLHRRVFPISSRIAARKSTHKRRLAKFHSSSPATLTRREWEEIVSLYGSLCAYCEKLIPNPTQDHLIPLSKGGSHTADNIVPACLSCNSSKGNKDLDEFLRRRA